jgi:hypothetical protein
VAYKRATIPVGQLMLDLENPRHDRVSSQREAIEALIAGQRQRMVALAADILEHGLSPIDLLLVVPAGKSFTVVEGNRRLAVIKILDNPALADGTVIATQMRRLSGQGSPPSELECVIYPARKDARHWMALRHGRGFEGAEVVPWNALAANRFSQNPGREASAAIRFLEALEAAYPKNEVILDLVQRVAEKRLTTIGRLVVDQDFQTTIGLVDKNGALEFHYPATHLESVFEHLLGDFAGDIGVSQIRTKELRRKYLRTVPAPDPKRRTDDPVLLTPARQEKPKPKPRRPSPAKKAKPLAGLDVSALGAKTQALVREVRAINPDKAPHAVAVLIRVLLELCVDEFLEERGLEKRRKLRDRVKTCLVQVDAGGRDPRFRAVRTGLQDGSSVYAVSTLHEFVHNRYFQAEYMHVATIADNVEPFLQALNDAI